MNTYKEIKRITGNNKAYAAIALNRTITENDWITGSDDDAIVYLRNAENDWVAIPAHYYDEGTEFNTVNGKSVILTADSNYNYIAIEAE